MVRCCRGMEFLALAASLEALGRGLPGGAGSPGVWLGLLVACGVAFILLLGCLAAYRVRTPPHPPPLPCGPGARCGADRKLGGR